jgi:D-alanine-D-alanine ligase
VYISGVKRNHQAPGAQGAKKAKSAPHRERTERSFRVGLTYDLRSYYLQQGYGDEETAEFDREETIEAIETALQELGHATDRVGTVRQLAERLVAGERWDLVFNIAEGLQGIGREAQVPCLLDAYGIPYTFSDPVVLSLALHKGFTKSILRDHGLATPEFAVVSQLSELTGLSLPYPLFAKPLAEGTGKGITSANKVEDPLALAQICGELLARYRQPVLVERYLPGREFTVGILGTAAEARSVGCMEVVFLETAEANAYSYVNKEQCEQRIQYRSAHDEEAHLAEETALAAWRVLGCRDAGRVDLRSDERGIPNLMELNPLAGLHPQHSDLPILCALAGISFRELIRSIVDSAARRIPRLAPD